MPGTRLFGIAAAVALAFTLVVLGAALRPILFPEKHAEKPILTELEIGFAQDMTAHHQQALQMALRLDSGADPSVRRLAQQMADTQRTEVGTMLGWLRLANASPLSPRPMQWMHRETSASHHHSADAAATTNTVPESVDVDSLTAMPGMATTAELESLAAARGRDAEILFLQLMIRHHGGGLRMAAAADSMLTHGAVKEAARAMAQAQSQEIGVMGLMLTQLGGRLPA
ncbi:DUF305 domain-containing protein [Nocardia sp. NPDC005366]|uniref:DUF305 domain-containing protein n=1 Tax=Nocardia sp. NPDC005366 TaxID=3156878 RepID=UPI0033BC66E7